MKLTLLISTSAMSLLALLAIPARTVAQEQPNTDRTPRYAVTDLGTLGGTFSAAFAINNRGNVAGAANLPSENQHAFLRRDGQMSDLGTLGGSNSNEGGLNERDELAIFSQTAQNDPYNENFCGFSTDSNLICLGGVWKNGKMSPLPTLGGNNATAFAINNKGQVAGLAESGTYDSSCVAPQVFDFEAAIWEPNGAVHELPSASRGYRRIRPLAQRSGPGGRLVGHLREYRSCSARKWITRRALGKK